MKEDLLKLLSELIEIYSPYFHEEKVMDFAYSWLKERNIPVQYHRYSENKVTNFNGTNIIGRIKGSKKGPRIFLNGHLDTVTISQGWTRDPLKATVEGDKLFGLGALDMKGGCAALMVALDLFMKNVKDFRGEIIYSLVSDEEGPYGLGTDALILDGFTEGIDMSLILEPSSGFADVGFPCICLGARGGYNYTINLYGKASHASNPELGIDAIVDGAKLICELNNTKLIEDPKLGKGSIAIIEFKGGGAACSIADKASITVFRHVVRGETKEYLIKEVEEAAKRANIASKYEVVFRQAPHEEIDGFKPYTVDEDNEYVNALQEIIKKVTGEYGKIEYFSSIGDFNHLGTRTNAPAILFGPYGMNYHSPDEWVSIDSLIKTCQVVYELLNSLLKI